MFEVGFTEIVLILGLALLVLGPEKLPGLAEKIGRWTGRARSMARQLRTQLEQEVTLEQMSKSRPMQPGPAAEPEPTPTGSSEASSTAEHRTGPQEPWAHSEAATDTNAAGVEQPHTEAGAAAEPAHVDGVTTKPGQ